MIYHILPEWEEFSTYRGGAVASIIANMMRCDPSSIVVCQSTDHTWGYDHGRVLVLPALRRYHKFYARVRGKRYFFRAVYRPLLHRIFRPLLARLDKGDVVWCHSQVFVCAALEKSIHKKGATLVYHVHSSIRPYSLDPIFRLTAIDAMIFVSEAIRLRALRIAPHLKNTYTVHNGVNHSVFYPSTSQLSANHKIPIVLFVGRLNPEKGVHVLMEAFRLLQERNVEVLCKVVGSAFAGGSKPTPYVNALLSSHPSNVEFIGYRAQTAIAEEYRAADILCCPSIFQDPFPGVPLEGMASGLPIVATTVGGIPEMAVGGGFLLVEPNSAPQLADAIEGLVVDQHLRAKIGAEGLNSSRRNFSWSAIYRKHQQVITDLSKTMALEERDSEHVA